MSYATLATASATNVTGKSGKTLYSVIVNTAPTGGSVFVATSSNVGTINWNALSSITGAVAFGGPFPSGTLTPFAIDFKGLIAPDGIVVAQVSSAVLTVLTD